MPSLGEGKGEEKGDFKSSYGKEDDVAGGDELERGELLMYVADESRSKLWGPESSLSHFVRRNTNQWEVAVEGERDGSGSPLKMGSVWRSIHGDYLDMMEEELGGIVRKNGGTMERFLLDAKHALNGGEGFLFEDENYHDFVELVQAMTDFEAFHEMMMKECRKALGGHAVLVASHK